MSTFLKAVRVAALGLLVAVSSVLQAGAAAAETTWAVMDVTSGTFLGGQGGKTRRPPASLAKMMTLYLTFEALRAGRLHWDDRIAMSANAASKVRMKLNVKAGTTISVREAVNAMIILSANDAATAMGEHLAGSEAAFARRMTEKGRQLGMRDTIFATPAGLTARAPQLTTAEDMARLGLALKRDFPAQYKLFSQRSFVFRGRTIHGHNNLMYRYAGVDGIKTGYTDAAGYNLVSSLSTPKSHLIGVVLGGRSAAARDNQMAALLNRFSHEKSVTVAAARPAGKAGRKGVKPVAAEDADDDEAEAETTAPRPADRPMEVADIIDDADLEQGDGGMPVAAEHVSARSSWTIQVGTSGSRKGAETLRDHVGDLLKAGGKTARGTVIASGSGHKALFRVRFSGTGSEKDAASACRVLKRSHVSCLPVRHS
ncbi:D-alanyl-D-alanine carboxypeptidase [Xaviernesmea rhizosphaerae]|uniref:D-alanyl-D-alanine carboxypeptidase n=1 Tax=Xaviernesmea rhizosphaerae TaxID=1672749 RepID=UPI002477D122|nr:D-alanyl-D-alanine carboxypeptidase [Xaviernesmea rhizosphaerae]